MAEVVDRYCTSIERARILRGLLDYRALLNAHGFISGYQWLAGSFVENCEANRLRPPDDIDVVTFFRRPATWSSQVFDRNFAISIFNQFFHPDNNKGKYHCDTYPIDLDAPQESIPFQSNYWTELFQGCRDSTERKGILAVQLFESQAETASASQTIVNRYAV